MNAISGAPGASGWEIPTAGTSKLDTAKGAQEVFLQLLVAQLKNQNPLSPADGMEFVSQLTQFSELEQLLAIRQDMGSIAKALAPPKETAEGGRAAGSSGAA